MEDEKVNSDGFFEEFCILEMKPMEVVSISYLTKTIYSQPTHFLLLGLFTRRSAEHVPRADLC